MEKDKNKDSRSNNDLLKAIYNQNSNNKKQTGNSSRRNRRGCAACGRR